METIRWSWLNFFNWLRLNIVLLSNNAPVWFESDGNWKSTAWFHWYFMYFDCNHFKVSSFYSFKGQVAAGCFKQISWQIDSNNNATMYLHFVIYIFNILGLFIVITLTSLFTTSTTGNVLNSNVFFYLTNLNKNSFIESNLVIRRHK